MALIHQRSWTKWVVLSIGKYSQTFFGSDVFYLQGIIPEAQNKPPQRFDLRYLGPDICQTTADQVILHIVLNCQIATQRTPTDIEAHLMRVGKAQDLLSGCIPIHKYGKDSVIDTGQKVAELQRISNVEGTVLGNFDPVSGVERSTVEAAYKVVFEE